MIRDVAYWEAWEREYLRNQPVDFKRNLAIMDAMYEHARLLGAIPRSDPLEGLEVKIRLARVVNAQIRKSPGTNRP